MKYYIVYNAKYGGFNISKKVSDYLMENFDMSEAEINALKEHKFRGDTRLVEAVRYFQKVEGLSNAFGVSYNHSCWGLEIEELSNPAYRIEEYDGKEEVIEVYCHIIGNVKDLDPIIDD